MASPKTRWIGLVFISMAISLVIIDGTIVNTIFPALIRDLELNSTEVQWVQESYILVFCFDPADLGFFGRSGGTTSASPSGNCNFYCVFRVGRLRR